MEANEKVWTEVGERFAALGRVMKDRYQRQAGLQADDAEPGRDARDALRGLADALDGVFTAAGETIRDPAVAEEAHQAARSLGAALSATFDDVDEGLRDRFGRTGARQGPDRKLDDAPND